MDPQSYLNNVFRLRVWNFALVEDGHKIRGLDPGTIRLTQTCLLTHKLLGYSYANALIAAMAI